MTREELGKLIAADEDEVPEEHDHSHDDHAGHDH